MLGKTNIPFVSKSDASEEQLVYEKYLTVTTGTIRKIEYINNMFFAYTSDRAVLYGSAVNSLGFIKKDGKNLVATHFIFHEGRYYFCNSYADKQEKGIIYATEDFTNYEEIVIEEDIYIDNNQKALFSVLGIFIDSQKRIVIMIREINTVNSSTYKLNLHIIRSFEDISSERIVTCSDMDMADTNVEDMVLLKDRIFIKKNSYYSDYVCDLEGNAKGTNRIESYANDYFFRHTTANDHISGGYLITNLYKSFNGLDWSKCPNFNIDDAHVLSYSTYGAEIHVIPINGKTCLIYKRQEKIYINIADTINKIGDSSNPTFEIELSEFNCINSIAQDSEGNTYMGYHGGIIIKFYIDADGITKLPEVQLVKTLAAKQALAEAKRYTDKKIEELKEYLESSIIPNDVQ